MKNGLIIKIGRIFGNISLFFFNLLNITWLQKWLLKLVDFNHFWTKFTDLDNVNL